MHPGVRKRIAGKSGREECPHQDNYYKHTRVIGKAAKHFRMNYDWKSVIPLSALDDSRDAAIPERRALPWLQDKHSCVNMTRVCRLQCYFDSTGGWTGRRNAPMGQAFANGAAFWKCTAAGRAWGATPICRGSPQGIAEREETHGQAFSRHRLSWPGATKGHPAWILQNPAVIRNSSTCRAARNQAVYDLTHRKASGRHIFSQPKREAKTWREESNS